MFILFCTLHDLKKSYSGDEEKELASNIAATGLEVNE